MLKMLFQGGPLSGLFGIVDTRHCDQRVILPLPTKMIAALDDGMSDVPRRTVTYEDSGSYAFDGARVYRMLVAG